MSDTGVSGARLSRLRSTADRRAEAWPLLPGPAGAPSPTKRDGVGAPRLGHGAQRRAGCWVACPAMRQRAVTYARHRHSARQRHHTPAPGVEGAPLGGGRATSRRGPKARKRLAPQGGRGPTPRTARQRLDRTLCGFGAADTALANGCPRVAWRKCAMPHAQGEGAQDITGVW